MELPKPDQVAQLIHDEWMSSKRERGIHSRLSPSGEELMVPYSQLSNEAKELNRALVRTVYLAIDSLAGSNGSA